jgi:hypothetical protein
LIRSADREINSELDSTTGKNVKEKVAGGARLLKQWLLRKIHVDKKQAHVQKF